MCLHVRRRSLQREEHGLGSSATDEAFTSSPPTSSCSSMLLHGTTSGPVPVHGSGAHDNGPVSASSHTPSVLGPVSGHVQSSSSPSLPASGANSAPAHVQRAKSLEGAFPGSPQMSAALPRGFRRSEGTSRLSAVVTPRPFGKKTSRRSTQPRFYSVRAFL